MPGDSLQKDLAELLNYWCEDAKAETPDVVLAKYLVGCLENFRAAVKLERVLTRGERLVGEQQAVDAVDPVDGRVTG